MRNLDQFIEDFLKGEARGDSSGLDGTRTSVQKVVSKIGLDFPLEAIVKAALDSKDPASIFAQFLIFAYRYARIAVEMGMENGVIKTLLRSSSQLLAANQAVHDTVAFLGSLMEKYASTRKLARETNEAFKSLVGGLAVEVEVDRFRVAKICLATLCHIFVKLTQKEREQVVEEVKRLSEHNDTDRSLNRLIEAVEHTNRILEDASAARAYERKSALSNPRAQFISVHSCKGGVGKSLCALSIALELASRDNGNKVCLVDADEKGPSLHFYTKTAEPPKEPPVFFAQWLCERQEIYPVDKLLKAKLRIQSGDDGYAKMCSNIEKNLFLLPGSICPHELDKLDGFIRGKRPYSGVYSEISIQIESLVEQLVSEHGFNHVIFDTGPGHTQLSYDIFKASYGARGTQLFVMRPRPLDFFEFCWDFLWLAEEKYQSHAIMAMNFVAPKVRDRFCNWDLLTDTLKQMPQFEAYADRFGGAGVKEAIETKVKKVRERIPQIGLILEDKLLRHAADFEFARKDQLSCADILLRNTSFKAFAKNSVEYILSHEETGTSEELKVAGAAR